MLLLRPLPFPDADRLVALSHADATTAVSVDIPPVRLRDWSDRYWRERRASDPGVLGQTLELDGQPWTIVGVLPAAFASVDAGVDVWTPHPVDAPWAGARLVRQGRRPAAARRHDRAGTRRHRDHPRAAGRGVSSRLLAGKLYGVSTTDPFTLATVVALVVAAAVLAATLPAARAARIDPMRALRED